VWVVVGMDGRAKMVGRNQRGKHVERWKMTRE